MIERVMPGLGDFRPIICENIRQTHLPLGAHISTKRSRNVEQPVPSVTSTSESRLFWLSGFANVKKLKILQRICILHD